MSTPDQPMDGSRPGRDSSAAAREGGVSTIAASLSGGEYLSLRAVAADPERPIEERVEALEDLIDSEVGDTDLTRARNIEREVGLRQLFLKFEGGNPTGTQKDRVAFAQVLDALRRGFDGITVATCGNYGSAVAVAAAAAGLRSFIHMPRTYRSKKIPEIESLGAEVVLVDADYEGAVDVSRELAVTEEIYDANPGGANSDLQMRAYGQIAYEVYDELRDAPAVVAVPVSNGTTLAGIHRGFLSLYRRGKTSRIPRFVAGSSYRKNPIVNAWLRELPECVDLEPSDISETPVNEPLINWHSIDGNDALWAIRESAGWAEFASDKAMTGLARLMREQQGLSVLPASTAGLVALIDRHQKEPLPGDRYVVILTGRRA